MAAPAAASGIVVQIQDNAGTPAYQTIGGLRTRRIALNAETVDLTNASSTNQSREILDAAGVKSLTISGDGVFLDDTAQNEINEAFLAQSVRNYKFTVPTLGTYTVPCKITQLEFSGDFNKEVTFSATFESAGDVAFA